MEKSFEDMMRDMMLDLANRITEVDLEDEPVNETDEEVIYVRKVTLEVGK